MRRPIPLSKRIRLILPLTVVFAVTQLPLAGVALALELVRQLFVYFMEQSGKAHAAWQDLLKKYHNKVDSVPIRTRTNARKAAIYTILTVAFVFMWDGLRQNLPTYLYFAMMMSFAVGQFVMIFWFMSRIGTFDIFYPEDVNTDWSDVYGQDKVVDRLKEVQFFLEKPEEIEQRGGYVPKGVLLWGPPGTGKTLMARAMAGTTGMPYVFVGPGAFTNMFFGVNILKVKRLFRNLRKLAVDFGGVICFMDEIDNLGSRGGVVDGRPPQSGTSLEEPEGCVVIHKDATVEGPIRDGIVVGGMGGGQMGTLEIFLSSMDGLVKPRGIYNRLRKLVGIPPNPPPAYRILFLAATNMPQRLDPALLRPGRLDRKLKVGYPNKQGRIETFKGYLNKVAHEVTDEQIEALADNNPYATGATIRDAVNEALILALREGRDKITWKDMRNAIIWKDMGDDEGKQSNVEDQRRVALHEAAHAVAAHHFRPSHKIQFASVVRRENTLGVVSSVPLEERFTRTKKEYLGDIMVSLASVWAERYFFNDDLSSGPYGDLKTATRIAQAMVTQFSMTKMLGVFPNTDGEYDHAVQELLIGTYNEMSSFLRDRRDQIEVVAQLLEEHGTVDGDQVHSLIRRMEGGET